MENDGHAAQSPTIPTSSTHPSQHVPTSRINPHQHSHVSFSESFKLKHTVVFFWVSSSLLSESSPAGLEKRGLAKEKIPNNNMKLVITWKHLHVGDFNQQHLQDLHCFFPQQLMENQHASEYPGLWKNMDEAFKGDHGLHWQRETYDTFLLHLPVICQLSTYVKPPFELTTKPLDYPILRHDRGDNLI